MEKLPKVFANGIERELKNNLEMFDSRLRNNKIKVDIRKEIDKIFNSKDFVYKSIVEIRLKDKVITTTLVGKNSSSIFTLDGNAIPINDIIEIKKRV